MKPVCQVIAVNQIKPVQPGLVAVQEAKRLKDPLPGGLCKAAQCTDGECCNQNPTCQDFKCQSSFYTKSTLKSTAGTYRCTKQICTEDECCVKSPTNALPEVKTWPLYPQNYQ